MAWYGNNWNRWNMAKNTHQNGDIAKKNRWYWLKNGCIKSAYYSIMTCQWEFQDPRMEVMYHIRPYFGGISPYIALKNRPYTILYMVGNSILASCCMAFFTWDSTLISISYRIYRWWSDFARLSSATLPTTPGHWAKSLENEATTPCPHSSYKRDIISLYIYTHHIT